MQAGVDTFRVAKLMGHRDAKMVERYYGHLKPKNLSDSMEHLPRFPELLAAAEDVDHAATEPRCVTGVSEHPAANGSNGTQTVPAVPPVRTTNSVISDEKAWNYGVRAEGLEPSTSGLRVRCSTIELCPRLGRETS